MNTNTPATAALSTIRALHARYEENETAYVAIDRADMERAQAGADQMLGCRYRDAMKESAAASDALRLAVLFQVPTDRSDALILQYHIRCQHDINANSTDEVSDQDKLALDLAIDALFDFMARDNADHAQIGTHLAAGVRQASQRCAFRTGLVGGAE